MMQTTGGSIRLDSFQPRTTNVQCTHMVTVLTVDICPTILPSDTLQYFSQEVQSLFGLGKYYLNTSNPRECCFQVRSWWFE